MKKSEGRGRAWCGSIAETAVNKRSNAEETSPKSAYEEGRECSRSD